MRRTSVVGGVRCRLSVLAEDVRVDVVVPAWLAVDSLIPSIIDAVTDRGGFAAGPLAVRYQLSTLTGVALDGSKSLHDAKIRDGTSLVLTRSSTQFSAARFDDAAEAVAAAVAAVDRPWTRRAAKLVTVVVTGWLAAVSATVLIRAAFGAGDGHRLACVIVAAMLGVVALIACRSFGECAGSVALGLLATGFTGLAGLFAVPGGPAALNALLAAAGATTTAAIIRAVTPYPAVFSVLGLFSMTCVLAAAVCALTAEPVRTLGAGLAATSLALLEAAAPASIVLTRLSTQPLPAADISGPHPLQPNAVRAHTWLNKFVASFAASATLGAVCAVFGLPSAGPPRLSDILLATATATVLLLRARAHRDMARSAPLIVCGAVTLGVVFFGSTAAWPRHAPQIAALPALLAVVAFGLDRLGGVAAMSPAGRRVVELVEYVSFAMVAPLALWVGGVYSAARGLKLW